MTDEPQAWSEAQVYQHIGEFVVCFQWLEAKLREIGWFVLDPRRASWPPLELRRLSAAALFDRAQDLFLGAPPHCRLEPELENDFRDRMAANALRFGRVRRARNRVLHSAYIEMKGGGRTLGILRADPRVILDPDTGEVVVDQEMMTATSFAADMLEMGELMLFLNRCYLQLIHSYPTAGLLKQ